MTALSVDPGIDMGGGVVVTDLYNYLEDCQKDDIMRFNSNGSITQDEGTTKCEPDDPQTTDMGSWILIENDQKVRITQPGGDSFEGTIITLNERTFVWTYEQPGIIKSAQFCSLPLHHVDGIQISIQ